MVIYKTTNLINGKFYIGKDSRNKNDYYGSGLLLNKAIKKYGKENFKKEIIETCSNVTELNEREIFWINTLNARNLDIGYNLAEGGFGFEAGYKRSKETNEKIIQMLKEREFTWGNKISESMKGKEKSLEHKSKISETMIEKYNNGYIPPSTGIIRSDEFKKKISDSQKGGSGRNKKSVIIEGVEYDTIKKASQITGISRYIINKLYFNES